LAKAALLRANKVINASENIFDDFMMTPNGK